MRRRSGLSAALLLLLGTARCSCQESLSRAPIAIAVDPEALDFGRVPDTEGLKKTVTVRSVGDLPLHVLHFQVVDDPLRSFAIVEGRTSTLAPGEQMTIGVFGAVALIERRAQAVLEIESDADDRPLVRVPLSIEAVEGARDAGIWPDAEPPPDAGIWPDAESDAGIWPDAESPPDLGAFPDAADDAGIWPDAAPPPDAGIWPDAGPRTCPTPQPLVQGYNPGLAWNGSQYGFSFRHTVGVQHTHFSVLDSQGSLQTPPGQVDLQSEASHSQDNWIAASPHGYGMVWSTITGITFRAVDLQGGPVGAPLRFSNVPYGAAVTYNADDDEWALAYYRAFARVDRSGALIAGPIDTMTDGTPDLVYNRVDHQYAFTHYDYAQSQVELGFISRSGQILSSHRVWTATVGRMLDGNAGNQRVRMAWNEALNEYGIVVRDLNQGGASPGPLRVVFLRVSATGLVLSSRELLPLGSYGYDDPMVVADGNGYLSTFAITAPAHSIVVMRLDQDGVPVDRMDCASNDWVYYPTIGSGPSPHPVLFNAVIDQVMMVSFP
ncbi:MAG: hypothetical protein U1E65_07545 [Myxococcota bacterium]